jgi:phosphoribosylformylglycinamidine synthase subunit PurL
MPDRAILFGETQARIVVSTSDPERVQGIAKNAGVPCSRIGTVRRSSENLTIKLPDSVLKAPLARLARAFHDTIPSIMSRTPEHTTFDELTQVAAH